MLVSKVWEWEVWCSAIWGMRCRARGKWDCKSVMMLFCASKGNEVEGRKERGERRCMRRQIPNLVVHRSVSVACTSVGCSA